MTTEPADPKLSDMPDWWYLLREYYEFYRFLSSGGSPKIRSHQRAVREAISRVMAADAPVHWQEPAQKPATLHLDRALDEGLLERHADVIRAIQQIRDSLSWQYGYDRVPRGLERKYAYAELVGPSGPVITDQVILGLVLFAPGCVYPAHAHEDITESYICLSGAVSENDDGVYGPGSLIFNPPGHHHRITTSKLEPSLLAYAWIGPKEKLAGQKMKFSRPGRNA